MGASAAAPLAPQGAPAALLSPPQLAGQAARSGADLVRRLGRTARHHSPTRQYLLRRRDTVLVKLTRSAGEKLGLQVTIMIDSSTLKVSEVSPGGLVEAWNECRRPEERVQRGHWIIAVNGEHGTTNAMFQALQQEGDLEFEVSMAPPGFVVTPCRTPTGSPCKSYTSEQGRPERIPLTVPVGPERSAGLEIEFGKEGVLILGINDGAIKDWNENCSEDQKVCVGDMIVFLNGVTKSAMLSTLFKAEELNMVLRRGEAASCGEVLPETFVAALPSTEAPEDEVCGICLGEWSADDEAIRLPCKHHFHKDCVSEWLTKHSANCPFCAWAADHPAGHEGSCAPLRPSPSATPTPTEEAEEDIPELEEEAIVRPHCTPLKPSFGLPNPGPEVVSL